MTEEVKEISDLQRCADNNKSHLLLDFEIKNILCYITNLQKENEKLKDNQVRALNKIKDYISASKCEILEGNYSNDKHNQYWKLFNKQLKEIQKLIKGININQYINIPKYREKELLNKEEKLENYKQRNEKAIKKIDNIFFALSSNNKNYNNLYIKLVDTEQGKDLLNILQGGDE